MPRPALLLVLTVAAIVGCGGADGRGRPAASAPPPVSTTTPARPPAAPPGPHERIPSDPRALAHRLATVDADLRAAVKRWLRGSPRPRAVPPMNVLLGALYQQRAYRQLARHPRQIGPALRALPRWLRPEARDSVAALHSLFTLTSHATEARFRAGPPQPPGVLRGYYRQAQRRFRVRWNVLAGVNMIESNFGRLLNVSNAGAVGPMQFLPATWRTYGLGGEIRDPRDAILGAANYLHASGAPGSYATAIFHYNPSPLYVRAVLRFAHRMASDPIAYYEYWSWQSFVRTAHGERQLTGPGANQARARPRAAGRHRTFACSGAGAAQRRQRLSSGSSARASPDTVTWMASGSKT